MTFSYFDVSTWRNSSLANWRAHNSARKQNVRGLLFLNNSTNSAPSNGRRLNANKQFDSTEIKKKYFLNFFLELINFITKFIQLRSHCFCSMMETIRIQEKKLILHGPLACVFWPTRPSKTVTHKTKSLKRAPGNTLCWIKKKIFDAISISEINWSRKLIFAWSILQGCMNKAGAIQIHDSVCELKTIKIQVKLATPPLPFPAVGTRRMNEEKQRRSYKSTLTRVNLSPRTNRKLTIDVTMRGVVFDSFLHPENKLSASSQKRGANFSGSSRASSTRWI